MTYSELIILLPCHSLDDFPTYHEGEEAESLLACWSAMFHPALLAAAEKLPTWYRADSPPEELSQRLVVVPTVSEPQILAGWAARAKNEGATVVRKQFKRAAIVEGALAPLDEAARSVDADLVADFLAVGSGYLLLELLVRHQRHYSNLDEVHIKHEAVTAAHAAMAGDAETARRHLKNCCETLLEAREQCYPAEMFLLDLTLLADSTLADLPGELDQPRKTNLLASGSLVEALFDRDAATGQRVREAWQAGTLAIVGGEYREQDLPLWDHEAILAELRTGEAAYLAKLGQSPKVYARRRNGLTPLLPQLLKGLGFRGGLPYTLDEGHFPAIEQSLVEWEGLDGSVILGAARVPLEANKPETFFRLPEKLGDAMDHDHVASLVFAHWPGEAQTWYDDLVRVTNLEPVFGRFVTFEEFFEHSQSAMHTGQGLPDEYRSPYLKQAIIRRRPDPTTRYRRALLQRLQLSAAQALDFFRDSLARISDATHKADLSARESLGAAARQLAAVSSPLLADDDAVEPEVDGLVEAAAGRLVTTLTGLPAGGGSDVLVFNPLPFARRVGLRLPVAPPASNEVVRASQPAGEGSVAVVDLPPCGYVHVGHAGGGGRERMPKPLADENTLRNEFFEVTIDPNTGGIRKVDDYRSRTNRLSYQLGYRTPGPRPKPGDTWQDPDLQAVYSSMRARSCRVTANGPALGEITVEGELVDREGQVLANFVQRYECWRSSRVLVIDLTLEPVEPARADPWNCYYAGRFALSDESSQLFRSVGLQRVPTEAKRLEAPLFVEAVNGDLRTLVLTGGAPFSKRIGLRMMDVLLNCRGDTATHFRLGVGLEVPYPIPAALNLLAQPPVVPRVPSAGLDTAWFFHVDRKNVLVTHWECLPESADGHNEPISGFRARLVETEGRGGEVRLRCPQTPAAARVTDLRGEPDSTLAIEGDAIIIEMRPRSVVQIEATW